MHLNQFFAFDCWANELWFDYLLGQDWPSPEKVVFGHILSAQKVWSDRILDGVSPTNMPVLPFEKPVIADLCKRWTGIVDQFDEGHRFEYKRTTGEPNWSTVGETARHLINHGTYHRGELRGLCRAAGRTEFPETDLLLWSMLQR
ncbi:MAG: DinB family protein [Armatimonadota bacterium]